MPQEAVHIRDKPYWMLIFTVRTNPEGKIPTNLLVYADMMD
jgi:hypothetical protein